MTRPIVSGAAGACCDGGGGGAPLPVGGDLSGTTSSAVVTAVQGQPWDPAPGDPGDVATWDGATWSPLAPTPQPTSLLQRYAWSDRLGLVSTTNAPASAVLYLSLGSIGSEIILTPGTYFLDVGLFVAVSNSNGEPWVDLRVSGVSQGVVQERLGVAGARTSRFGRTMIPLIVGDTPLYFDLYFAKGGGTGSVSIDRATIDLFKELT